MALDRDFHGRTSPLFPVEHLLRSLVLAEDRETGRVLSVPPAYRRRQARRADKARPLRQGGIGSTAWAVQLHGPGCEWARTEPGFVGWSCCGFLPGGHHSGPRLLRAADGNSRGVARRIATGRIEGGRVRFVSVWLWAGLEQQEGR